LFRIAHNRCIDFLRRKGVRDEAEAAAAVKTRCLVLKTHLKASSSKLSRNRS
jgi:DNA-directed RNA polymerase specialized sigma24 family protein